MLRIVFVSLINMYVKFVEISAMCIGFDNIIGEVKGLAKYILVKNMNMNIAAQPFLNISSYEYVSNKNSGRSHLLSRSMRGKCVFQS